MDTEGGEERAEKEEERAEEEKERGAGEEGEEGTSEVPVIGRSPHRMSLNLRTGRLVPHFEHDTVS